MDRDIEQGVKEVMADVLGIDPEVIGADTSRENTPGWDSANHITLSLALEDEFAITLDVSEIESMFSFAEIVQVIEAKF